MWFNLYLQIAWFLQFAQTAFSRLTRVIHTGHSRVSDFFSASINLCCFVYRLSWIWPTSCSRAPSQARAACHKLIGRRSTPPTGSTLSQRNRTGNLCVLHWPICTRAKMGVLNWNFWLEGIVVHTVLGLRWSQSSWASFLGGGGVNGERRCTAVIVCGLRPLW